jgi:hypothetical protein
MAVVFDELIQLPDQSPEELAGPENVTDADGLSRLHDEAYARAGIRHEDGSGELVHEDDPSFRFVVGHFESGQFIKLGNNGVHTLVYSIQDTSQDTRVYQHVGKGDVLSPGDDITDKSTEIAAVGHLLQKGK